MKDSPVLLLVHNCLELTKRCVDSIKNQDIPTYLLVIDNASTDETFEWLQDNQIHTVRNDTNEGVSAGWNWGLDALFGAAIGYEFVLCPNNDTILPRTAYSDMLAYNAPFVTGASFHNLEDVMSPENRGGQLTPGPDFSLFLIRKDTWRSIGHFDPKMALYFSDNDYHVRAHRAGIPLLNSHVKFYHERSSTVRNADPIERKAFTRQFEADREAFRAKYGCLTSGPEYEALFKD